jgi:hypothetical protein
MAYLLLFLPVASKETLEHENLKNKKKMLPAQLST